MSYFDWWVSGLFCGIPIGVVGLFVFIISGMWFRRML